MIRTAAICLAGLGLAGCQSMVSRHVDYGSGAVTTGIQYAAPKAMLRVELFAVGRENDRADLFVAISRPFLVGDPEATFALSASTSMLAEQKYIVVVNPQTRLLTYINSQSRGQADEIVKNLAQSIGAIGSVNKVPTITDDESGELPANQELLLYSTVIDPFAGDACTFGASCELKSLNSELRERALRFYDCTPSRFDEPSDPSEPPLPNPNRAVCNKLRHQDYFSISIDPLFEFIQHGRLARPEDCRSSICYRAPAPYLLGVRIGDISDHSELVMLPNESPVLAMELEAGVFADAKSRVDLVQGMPVTIAVERESELVAITALPLQVITSLFKAVGEVFQLRVDFGTDTVDLLDSERKRLDALDNYNAFLRERDAAAAALVIAQQQAAAAPAAQRAVMEQQVAVAETNLSEANQDLALATANLAQLGTAAPLGDGEVPELADSTTDTGSDGDENTELELQIDPWTDPAGARSLKLNEAPLTIEKGSADRLLRVNIITGSKDTTTAPVNDSDVLPSAGSGNADTDPEQ